MVDKVGQMFHFPPLKHINGWLFRGNVTDMDGVYVTNHEIWSFYEIYK